eukprot:TRINITY_DN838_c0_g1_i1.p1 TRINITY_DN838_c0_g1~~TRINITY_DN838_c0_g1_i1.p1  ORF type:complete len:301 (-),score=75.52 TRINITY_DN838_c0_g1_i1:86-988(-)
MASSLPSFTLNSGHTIPSLGFGTWKADPGVVGKSVKIALESGYRHIDCAAIYGNEKEIGATFKEVFAEGKIKREEVFITSKLWNSCHRKEHVRGACEQTLKDLELEYLDLYLIHWPFPLQFAGYDLKQRSGGPDMVPLQETWQAMEALVDAGLVKSIGISNFNVQLIRDLLTYARIKPAVNQVEIHPFMRQARLVEHTKAIGDIHTSAYSPLGNGKLGLQDETVLKIAKKHNRTAANVMIKWGIQYGVSVLPKSVTPERILENANLDFTLTGEDLEDLAKLERNERTAQPADFFKVPLFD